MTEFTDEQLNNFRKKVGKNFYVPPNYIMHSQIANTPMWMRELFREAGKAETSRKVR